MVDDGGGSGAAAVLAVLLSLQELAGQVCDAAAGHRAACVKAGFSESAAEVMAVDFQRAALTWLFNRLDETASGS